MEDRVKTPWLTNGLLIAEIVAVIAIFISVQGQFQSQSARSDFLSNQIIELIKEIRPQRTIECRGWKPYEDVMPQPTDWMIKDPK
jgi:hypothetical protein